jgi:hypothetical protein
VGNKMKLTKGERRFLMTLMTVAQKMLNVSSVQTGQVGSRPRKRRSGADVALLRKEVRAALKRKVPVKEIADKLGVTPAYIYQLRDNHT